MVNYAPLVGLLSAPIETLDTFSLSQDPQGDNPNFAKSCSVWSNGAGAKDSTFCDPIYPFQYGTSVAGYYAKVGSSYYGPLGDDVFYDAPQGLWPDASFEAVTLLSEVDTATDTLTVYQGVEYGFTLTAAEPPAWALALGGFAALALAGAAAKRKALAA